MTWSLHSGESPAMLPSAHTACSCTSSLLELSNSMNMGTAPASITIRVCSDVPEAMFVSAQAASNYPKTIFSKTKFGFNLNVSYLERAVSAVEVLDKSGHDACLDDLVDGWIWLSGQQLAELLCSHQLLLGVLAVERVHHFSGDAAGGYLRHQFVLKREFGHHKWKIQKS